MSPIMLWMPKRGVADALYWKLHRSYLLNDRRKSEYLLGAFLDEAKGALEDEICPIHARRFRAIREGILSGTYARIGGGGVSVPSDCFLMQPEDDAKEKDFHKELMAPPGRGVLFGCLGISDQKATMLHEYDLGTYGRCDFLIREGRAWYAIEVKIGEAKPEVSAQVDKYRLALELDMVLGMHDEVFAAVVANGFCPYAASELSRMGVIMIAHQGSVSEGLRRMVP